MITTYRAEAGLVRPKYEVVRDPLDEPEAIAKVSHEMLGDRA